MVDALGGQVSYAYDANYNPTSVTDQGGHTVSYTYNNMGSMLTRTDAAGTYTVTYNNLNLPLTVAGPNNGTTGPISPTGVSPLPGWMGMIKPPPLPTKTEDAPPTDMMPQEESFQ